MPIPQISSMDTEIFQLVLLLSISVLCSSSAELKYPAVFNFGDSNSDTGNLVAGTGFKLDPPYGEMYFGSQTGRVCDGRLIVDFLMYAMDLPFLNAYLDSVGLPNLHSGCNFAAAGATIQPATASTFCPFSFGIQVAQFLRLKARTLTLLSQSMLNNIKCYGSNSILPFHVGSESLDEYIPAEDYFYKGLYMFDIGQNDLTLAFYSKTYDEVVASIPAYLQEFQAGIQRLYDEGARNFWIHNTGPLGCLAFVMANGAAKSKHDELGCVQTHNQAAMAFNHQLQSLCRKLQEQHEDINITYVDIFTIKLDLIRNYTQYGFEQPVMACCGYGGPPLNFDSRVRCGATAEVDGTSVTAKGCNDSSKYVSWDGVHYTEAANQHVALQILTGKYTKNLRFSDTLPSVVVAET